MFRRKKRVESGTTFGRKKRVADPFYMDIDEGQVSLYQGYVERLVAALDVENIILWAMAKPYDKEKFERDDRLLEKVCCKEAVADGLSPVYLQIMINQYFFADPDLRESYESTWVETVVYNQEKASFFPRATKVRKMLEAVS